MKIGIVCSCGGHLTEVQALERVYREFDHFFVVNNRIELPPEMQGRTYFICHAERDWRVLVNFWEAWRILRRERPDIILSTGAGPAVPFGVIAKLRRLPVIFIETCAQVSRPSLTGRIMYHLAERFFFQWPSLQRHYPRATYGRLL